jgi:hypothetical protein
LKSSCLPCTTSMPAIQEFSDQVKDDGRPVRRYRGRIAGRSCALCRDPRSSLRRNLSCAWSESFRAFHTASFVGRTLTESFVTIGWVLLMQAVVERFSMHSQHTADALGEQDSLNAFTPHIEEEIMATSSE